MPTICYEELNQMMIERHVKVFDEERVRAALEKGGFNPRKGDLHIAELKGSDERLFRRLLLTFSRSMGMVSTSATKAVLVEHCKARELSVERHVKKLLTVHV